MIINRINILSFKSNEHREAELRELQRLRELRRRYEEEKLIQSMTYPEIDNQISTKAAAFFCNPVHACILCSPFQFQKVLKTPLKHSPSCLYKHF